MVRRLAWHQFCIAVVIAATSFVTPSRVEAQVPAKAIGIGFGVDTTIADVHNIVALTRAYLAKPDSSARARGLWSMGTKLDAGFGDIALTAYQGFNATILAVTPAFPGDSVYTRDELDERQACVGPGTSTAVRRTGTRIALWMATGECAPSSHACLAEAGCWTNHILVRSRSERISQQGDRDCSIRRLGRQALRRDAASAYRRLCHSFDR